MGAKSLFSTTGSNVRRLLQKLGDRPIYIIIILITSYTAYFSYYTILKHYTFHSTAYDLGVYMQSFWTTIHGYGFFYTSLWEGSLFAPHFQPIVILILPLYAAFPKAETLLILQSLVLALGALPVYWIAKDKLGAKAGVVFAGLYLFYPALHGINSFDFHPVAFAIPILLFCFYMFEKKHYKRAIVLAVLAMMCKENVALVVILMGFYWLWIERRRSIGHLDWKGLPREREVVYPLCLSLLGLIWFLVAIYILIPYFNPHGGFSYFGRYEMALNDLLFNIVGKASYVGYLLAPLAFTSLLHPAILIGLPIFIQNLLPAYSGMYEITNQHPSLLIPWIFIASIYGVKWLSTVLDENIRTVSRRLLWMLLLFVIVVTWIISPSPIAPNRNMPQLTSHTTTLEQAISLIPKDASVYAQNDVFPHICHRVNAYFTLSVLPVRIDFFQYYIFPASVEGRLYRWSHGGNYDYILADFASNHSMFRWCTDESLERLEREYGIFAQGDWVYLYKRGYEGEPLMLGGK